MLPQVRSDTMKKVLTFSIATLAALAFTAGSSFACGSSTACSAAKKDGKLAASSTSSTVTTDGKLASSSKSCSAAKKDGKLASSGYVCSAHKNGTTATNASYANLPANAQTVAANHYEKCGINGNYELVNISVKGMTCGGCEYGLKDALANVDGVNHVINVDHKEGIAQVCTSKKIDHAAMTTAISSKGFEAQIIPAVAKTTSKSTAKASLSNAKGAGCSAAYRAKGKNVSAKTKTTAKKVSDTQTQGDTY